MILALPLVAWGQPGTDPRLPCGVQPQQPAAACLATGPVPGEAIPVYEESEGRTAVYGPEDPPPWTPAVYDPGTHTETVLPIPPGYIDYDPGYHAYAPGSRGCAPDLCGLPSLEGVIGADTREHIPNTTAFPWRAIGLILAKWDNGLWYQGSGTMIGPNQLLTCGHNVHADKTGATGKWATEFEFYAGQTSMTEPNPAGGVRANPNARPYGKATWTKMYFWKAWTTKRDSDYDMMLIILDKPIGNKTGWFARETGFVGVGDFRNLSGYPADKPQDEQWYAGGTVSAMTAHQVLYDNDTFGGHSGSPVWRYNPTDGERLITAVHTGHVAATVADPNRGVLLNRGKFDQLTAWIALASAEKAVAPCDDCGPDCNANGVSDARDIALGTSQDVNLDGIPDECQADLLQPADEIVCSAPNTVPVGWMASISVYLSRNSVALANRWVSFRSPTGNVHFLDGYVGPGGGTALAATDADGTVSMHFRPTAQGPGSIRAEVMDGALGTECTFIVPLPVSVTESAPPHTTLQVPVDRGAAIEIHYSLGGTPGPVWLDAFDIAGRHVRTLEREMGSPGSYVKLWDRRSDDGQQLARGIYIVRLRVGSEVNLSRKLALVRR